MCIHIITYIYMHENIETYALCVNIPGLRGWIEAGGFRTAVAFDNAHKMAMEKTRIYSGVKQQLLFILLDPTWYPFHDFSLPGKDGNIQIHTLFHRHMCPLRMSQNICTIPIMEGTHVNNAENEIVAFFCSKQIPGRFRPMVRCSYRQTILVSILAVWREQLVIIYVIM